MALKHCKKGQHETDVPVFWSPQIGGIIWWLCECGQKKETTEEILEKVKVSNG